MRASRFTMACRVDLTLLLPERTAKQDGQSVDFSVQNELLPIGSVSLTKPKILGETQDRYNYSKPKPKGTAGAGTDEEAFAASLKQTGSRRKKNALALGEYDLLEGEGLKLDPAALAWVDISAPITGLVGVSCDWERNPLSEPDTCSVVVRADELPIDLRILRGAQVDVWLYTHGDPNACKKGQAGHFAGIVKSISKDRNSNEISLDCVDYTWALNQAKMTPAMMAVELDRPFDDVLRAILSYVPGASRWKVNLRSEEFSNKAKTAFGLKGKKRKEKRTHYEKIGDPKRSVAGRTSAEIYGYGMPGKSSQDIVDKSRGFRKVKYVGTVIKQPTVGHAIGTSDRTVWETIQFMAALVGYVPNIGQSESGEIRVELLTPEEVQTLTSDFARKMVDGNNISVLTESLDFDSRWSNGIDRIEVRCSNPDTGKTFRGMAGRSRGRWQHDGRIEVQVAYGLTSNAECANRAAELWRSYMNSEFTVEVETMAPWSVGGGPDTPDGPGYYSDLLFAESGEPVQIAFAGLEAAAKATGATHDNGTFSPESLAQAHQRLLQSRGVPADSARKIATAMQEQAPSTLFQIRTLTHSFDAVGDGGYSARMTLDAFLDRPDDQAAIFREQDLGVAP